MEFLFYLALFWVATGLISWILMIIFAGNSKDGLSSDTLIGALLLGPIIFIMMFNDHRESKKWEEEFRASEKIRKEKAAATRKKKKDKALNNLPTEIAKVKQAADSIQKGVEEISDDFFDSIEKICSYCSSLTKRDIKDKQEILALMLFSKEYLEIFYKSDENHVSNSTGPKIAKASGVVGASSRKSSKPKLSKKDQIEKKINAIIKKIS